MQPIWSYVQDGSINNGIKQLKSAPNYLYLKRLAERVVQIVKCESDVNKIIYVNGCNEYLANTLMSYWMTPHSSTVSQYTQHKSRYVDTYFKATEQDS